MGARANVPTHPATEEEPGSFGRKLMFNPPILSIVDSILDFI